jgi:hypothetical protein
VLGGGGGFAPLQNMLSLLEPPHGSAALPEQAMLQSVEGSLVLVAKTLPQSATKG